MSRICLLPLTALLACARTFGDMPSAPQAMEPEVTASEGGTAVLRCLFHGNPPPKITWRFRAHTIDGTVGRYKLMSDGTLQIVSLYRNDTGVYICVAENVLGVATQVIQLVVDGGDSEWFTDNCNELNSNCVYGVEKLIGIDGLKRCKCKQNPCKKKTCGAGERCVVQKPQASESFSGRELLLTAICATMLKAGDCPTEETNPQKETCVDECKDDADCREAGKCCRRGCSHLCLAPVVESNTYPCPTAALAPVFCRTSPHGCCQDNKTPAHGPDFEGCCLLQAFGCCPDNRTPAEGPHYKGCGCQFAPHGCCPDNITIAQGPDNQGCGCEYTQHGCCPDWQTAASGPNNEGCTCKTNQFGCCADGVTFAEGPEQQGCHCIKSKFGCCRDGETPANGPDAAGCCSSSKHGCCLDGRTEAVGPKFLGCTDAADNKQAACSMSRDPGPCSYFTTMWYYDMAYGGCASFWYGGCDGNGNRFRTKEECEGVCIQPSPEDVCKLPSVKGACFDFQQRWHYNSVQEQCIPFRYGGCLGNANNFVTRELCQKQCEPSIEAEQCNLPIDEGSCAGSYSRWGFNSKVHRCEQFIWGGCEGNSNRFNSEAACKIYCAEKLSPQCIQPQKAGNCTEKEALWSFSQSENRCLPFYYSGCGGNDNRFSSRETCAQTCPSAYDPAKTTVEIAEDENVEVIGELGKRFQLHCPPSGASPNITWYHEESPLVFSDMVYKPQGNVLIIRELVIKTLGLYTCKAIYREGQEAVARRITLQAYKPDGYFSENKWLVSRDKVHTPGTQLFTSVEPAISTTTSEPPTPFSPLFTDSVSTTEEITEDENATVTGELGKRFELQCQPSGDPSPNITWYRDHEESPSLFNDTVYKPQGNVLIIRELAIKTLGLYICKAVYGEGQAAMSRGIIVQAYKPDGYFSENKLLVSRGQVPTTETQLLTPVEPTITTTNGPPTTLFIGSESTTEEIAEDENARLTGELGKQFELQCQPGGDPSPNITWYRDHEESQLLFNDTVYKPQGNVLIIRELAIKTLGLYTCKAINGEGQAAMSRGIIVQAYKPIGYFSENKLLVSRGQVPTTETQLLTSVEPTSSTTTNGPPTTFTQLYTDGSVTKS